MAYRLKISEKSSAGLARIITEQSERLGPPPAAPELRAAWVHDTRKGLKRLRALLRLLRQSADPEALMVQEHALRDLGRRLSAERVRDILPAALALVATEGGMAQHPALTAASARLEQERASPPTVVASPARRQDSEVSSTLAALMAATSSLTSQMTSDAVVRAIGRDYARGRRQLQTTYTDPGPQSFHDLRKLVQLHWRHCQIMLRAWPEEMAVRMETARQLSALLGQENDLAELCDWLAGRRAAGLSASHADALLAKARHLREQRRLLAQPTALRLYAEPRRDFEKRLQRYRSASDLARRLEKPVRRRPRRKDH